MTRLELGIAWRYLRSRGGSRLFSFISAIAIGGVIVGVSALIVINGVMTGMQDDLRDKILIGSPDLRVLTFGDDLRMDSWRPTLEKVRAQRGVVAAAPFVLSQGLAVPVGRNYSEAVFVEGIEPADTGAAEVTRIRHYATQGDFRFASSDGEKRGAVLGSTLANNLNVYIGDKINLISPADAKFNAAIGSIVPRIVSVEVTGIFETGMYEYDNSYVFVALDVAQQFAGLGSDVTGIEAKTPTRSEAAEVGHVLADSLGYPYRVVDWQSQNSSLFQALKLEKLAMSVILALIMIVAAFNIVSTLTMVVAD
jgi:lipoprotein-releasing system permease protein